jgi:hypothetical protein
MRFYKVVWFDDEHEEMADFKSLALDENINLIPFKSARGLDYLENNLEQTDAVILDAMFFLDDFQEKGTEDLRGFKAVRNRIEQLKTKKNFPTFILSGQTRFDRDITFNELYGKHYRKSNPKDIDKLFVDIRDRIEHAADNSLKEKYDKLLQVCDDRYIGLLHYERLFAVIKQIESDEVLLNTEDMFVGMRKILESIFIKLSEHGIIPKGVVQSPGWINGASLFLAGKHINYEFDGELVHPMVAENIYRLLNILQDGSHGAGNLKLRVDDYVKTSSNDYLYRSTAFLLFDVLSWFKEFVDGHENVESNQRLWRVKEETKPEVKQTDLSGFVSGKVINLQKEKGFAFFKPDDGTKNPIIPKAIVTKFSLQDGDSILGAIESYTDKKDGLLKLRVIDVKFK